MKSELMKVSGMTCGGCVGKVIHALNAIPGVSKVEVSLSGGSATVEYDERIISPDQLKGAVSGAGYGAGAAAESHAHQSKGGCCG